MSAFPDILSDQSRELGLWQVPALDPPNRAYSYACSKSDLEALWGWEEVNPAPVVKMNTAGRLFCVQRSEDKAKLTVGY